MTKVTWTREKILAEFTVAIKECKTRGELRTKHSKLMHGIQRQYKTLDNFAEVEGFTLPSKTARQMNHTKEFIDSEIKRLYSEGINISSYYLRDHGYRHIVNAAKTYHGSWNNALINNNIAPKAKYRTKEEVMAEYLSDMKAGKPRSKLPY